MYEYTIVDMDLELLYNMIHWHKQKEDLAIRAFLEELGDEDELPPLEEFDDDDDLPF